MGVLMYRGCVDFREWGERMKLAHVVSLGKLATVIVSRIVRVGGRKKVSTLHDKQLGFPASRKQAEKVRRRKERRW
jgi:hypothetical protein